MKLIIALCLVLYALPSQAARCIDWMEILGQQHNVWILKKHIDSDDEFKIQIDNQSSMSVALPKKPHLWRAAFRHGSVEIKDISRVHTLDLKNNKCENTNVIVLGDRKNSLLYDWKLCEMMLTKVGQSLNSIEQMESAKRVKGLKINQLRALYATLNKKISDTYIAAYAALPKETKEEFRAEIARVFKQRKIVPDKKSNFIIETLKTCKTQTLYIDRMKKEKPKFSKPWSAIPYE